MMPPKYRGRVDIWINGTYWAGATIGSFAVADPPRRASRRRRLADGFLIGPVLGMVVIVVGRDIPETPRWLMTHGRGRRGRAGAGRRSRTLRPHAGSDPVTGRRQQGDQPERRDALRHLVDPAPGLQGRIRSARSSAFDDDHPVLPLQRDLLHLCAGPRTSTGSTPSRPIYLLSFALGNLLGPLILGPLFDTLGRQPMIFGTYRISAFCDGQRLMFGAGVLDASHRPPYGS